MNDTLLAFMKRVSEDTELRAQVDGLKGLGPEDMAARAAAIAQDAGFELSSEDFMAEFDESGTCELDERELSAVGGGKAAMRRKAAYVSSPAYTVIPSTTACALPAARERSSVAALHVRFIRLQPKYDHTAGETHKAQPMLVSIKPYRDTVRGHPERDVRFLRGTGKPSVFA